MKTIAVIFKDVKSFDTWLEQHKLGYLLSMAKSPFGPRVYVASGGERTHVSFFQIIYKKDVYALSGRVFDDMILLDTYGEDTLQWLATRRLKRRTPTMRVIRESKFKSQIWRGTCSNCDAIFECDRKEIEDKIKMPDTHGMHRGVEYALVQCSECGHHHVTFHFHKNLVEPPTDE